MREEFGQQAWKIYAAEHPIVVMTYGGRRPTNPGWGLLLLGVLGCNPLPAEALGTSDSSGTAASEDSTTAASEPMTTSGPVLDSSTSGSTSGLLTTTTSSTGEDSTSGDPSGSSVTGDPRPACGDGLVAADEMCHELGPIIALDPAPDRIAVGDLDGDGAADLVFANVLSPLVVVLYGVGDGNFVAPQILLDAGAPVADLVLEDFSGNGSPDLVVTDTVGTRVVTFANDGSGGMFFAGQFPAGLAPVRLTAGLVDDDAIPDLIALSNNMAQVMRGNGLAGFIPSQLLTVPNGPHGVGLFALDLDPALDLLTINQGGGNTSCFPNLGDMFDMPVTHDTANAPLGPAVGDINGDGALDILVTHAAGDDVGVLLNDGMGAFGSEEILVVDDDPRAVILADLDTSGTLDMLTAHTTPGLVVMHPGVGDGTFGMGPSFEVPAVSQLNIAQLNGDGVPDVVLMRTTDSSVQVLLSAP